MSSSSESGETNQWVKGDLPPAENPKPKKTRAPAPAKVEDTRKGTPIEAAPTDGNGALSLEALVESLLFVADEPVPVAQLANALEVNPREVEAALTALAETYAQQPRGLRLQRSKDKVQLTTAPAAAERVQRFLGLAASAPLTRAALETLAIIAYQQPVTRPQIEAVRGVNSDSVLKNLLSKGLIEEAGRSEGPGRPVLYATTPEFLQHFGLMALAELPPLNLDQAPVLSEPTGEAAEEVLKG
jgi:segregation and condensation protein B